jgi:proteasome lid subunit RPN8/RPN11
MFDKIELTQEQVNLVREHTLACHPEEMCGFLTQTSFIPVKNIAKEPLKSFEIAPQDYLQHVSETIAIVHSHCRSAKTPEILDLRTPSYADFCTQKGTNLPWLIVSCEGITVSDPIQFPRIPNNNYSNRRFLWFINDCYCLVQDFYQFELGIKLKDYVVNQDYKTIRNLSNLFDDYITDYGFKEVQLEQIQEGDLILIDNEGFERNHLGIYTKGKVLHQGMLSALEPFEHFLGRIHIVLHYVG